MNTQHSLEKDKEIHFIQTFNIVIRILVENTIGTLQPWQLYNFIKRLKHYKHLNEEKTCSSDLSSLLSS